MSSGRSISLVFWHRGALGRISPLVPIASCASASRSWQSFPDCRLHPCRSRHSRGVGPIERDPALQFEALYREHHAAVVRFVYRRVPRDAVDEVVAETFAIAWRKLDSIEGDALPWLYVVARNTIAAGRRAQDSAADKARNLASVRPSSSPDPGDAVGERDLLRRAFAGLSENDREALRLTAWEGLDQSAAARVCGISRVAFAMRLSRARRRLAAALAIEQTTEERAA